jgi:hypothetical protein
MAQNTIGYSNVVLLQGNLAARSKFQIESPSLRRGQNETGRSKIIHILEAEADAL